MKLLILGGTVFLGRHIVEVACARGHEVTLFNRGQHNPDLFPEVEKLRGDRDGGLFALQGRQWDAAIDTCGFVPRIVGASAAALAHAVRHYAFISSISVYADFSAANLGESAPVGTLADATQEKVTNETYGPLKALCEQAAEQAMPGRTLVVRPGLIVGPDDPTDRFTYWPWRVAQGGEMLAPGRSEQPVQFIDVRDLAAWIVNMVEANRTGIYQATGPDDRLSIGQMLEECQQAMGSDARFTWIGDALAAQLMDDEVANFQPWVPEAYAGMRNANCQRAIAAGLTFRSLSETIRDTLAWKAASPSRDEMRSGLTRDKERELLV